jgi:hypothetical protein
MLFASASRPIRTEAQGETEARLEACSCFCFVKQTHRIFAREPEAKVIFDLSWHTLFSASCTCLYKSVERC